jgi:hypothetical protein
MMVVFTFMEIWKEVKSYEDIYQVSSLEKKEF